MPGESEEIFYEGRKVYPAKLVGAGELLYTNDILFNRPRWISDDDARTCFTCDAKFTAVKRKHHCRNCGRVCCNSCCKDKVLLKHLGYNEVERVCKDCRLITHVLGMAFNSSAKHTEKLEAAEGLSKMFQKPADAQLLIELGGIQALVVLSKGKDPKIRATVIETLQGLSQDPVLHSYLVENQVLSVVCRLLDDTHPQQDSVIMVHCITILSHFCKFEPHSHSVLQAGGAEVLLQLSRDRGREDINNQNTISLLALQCLALLLDHPSVCEVLYDRRDINTLARIMALLQSTDEKVQEICMQILATISTVSNRQRQKIIQEDMYTAGVLCKVLRSSPSNLQVLINAACLIANLASVEFTQGSLTEHLSCLCGLLSRFPNQSTLLTEVARGIVNLSAYPNNSKVLVENLTVICKTLLCSTNTALNQRGMLITLNLLSHSPDQTVDIILRSSARQFIQTIAGNETILSTVRGSLQQSLPTVTRPTRLSISK